MLILCFITFSFYLSSREKELAAVKINQVDVDIIANELEVSSYILLCLCIFSGLLTLFLLVLATGLLIY